MEPKSIYLLIGPKGSGKSYVGALIDQVFGIKFLRVEDWAKDVKKDYAIDDENYLSLVFNAIETGVRNALQHHDAIVFESTGLTKNFDEMLASLNKDYLVKTIGLKADLDLCLERVKTRDQSIHINVSDEQVNRINGEVLQRDLPTRYQLLNQNKTRDELILDLIEIVKHE